MFLLAQLRWLAGASSSAGGTLSSSPDVWRGLQQGLIAYLLKTLVITWLVPIHDASIKCPKYEGQMGHGRCPQEQGLFGGGGMSWPHGRAFPLLLFPASIHLLPLPSLCSVLDLNAFERQNKAEGLGMVTEDGTSKLPSTPFQTTPGRKAPEQRSIPSPSPSALWPYRAIWWTSPNLTLDLPPHS